MMIIIPSMDRAHLQKTYQSLPEEIRKVTHIAVPLHQVGDYKAANPEANLLHVVEEVQGIGSTRDYIVGIAAMLGEKKVLMLDDDLVFATRRFDDPTKFVDSDEDDIIIMIEDIEEQLDIYAHVGVATREGGNRNTAMYAYNTRTLRALAYRTDVLKYHGIQFKWFGGVMEDFNVSLSLLTLGYQNTMLNWIVHSQPGSNTAGGCSSYRTLEAQAKAAGALATKFPDFVSVVHKQTKTSWGGQERLDVVIQWKRAYEFGRSRGLVGVLDPGATEHSSTEGRGGEETLDDGPDIPDDVFL